MKAHLSLLLAAAAALPLTTPSAVPTFGSQPDDPQEGVFAFVDVNVLPMDAGPDILPSRTVIVRDGVIETVGSVDDVEVPAGATVIDGSTRYLMPGLAEMHAHVPPVQGDGWPARQQLEDIMFLYIANGVTSIRGMLGAPYQLELARQLENGEMLGPTFYVGAPSLNNRTAPTPEDAERLVRAHARAGYDLQKIHPGLSRETWDRMVEVADEVGLTFGGHVPQAVGLEHALETGMSTVDHLDGYVNAVAAPGVRERLLNGRSVPLGEVVASSTDARIREIARMTREAGTWVVPTMYLWENLYGAPDPDSMLALPEMKYATPQWRQGWRRQGERRGAPPPDVIRAHNELRRDILKILVEEGVGVLMGTDSPQMYNVPGFALHREIQLMRESGMTPHQVLVSGTRNVARYAREDLGLDGDFGTVEPGNRADLVLLDANPLVDLENLTRRAGVMVRGTWVSAEEITEGLAELERRFAGSG